MQGAPSRLDRVNGILFIDKSEGWTSHDAVAKTRRVLGVRRVGHAGTLDPMATGLLTLGVGPATRLLTHLVGLDKTYTATIRLGESTPSDDRMSAVTTIASADSVTVLTQERIENAAGVFIGDIEQVPSQVSAIKVGGRRAYELAREGQSVDLKKRPVTIHVFDVHGARRETGVRGNPVIDVDVTVECSSGTYIRALARDLGEHLGVGGHLTALRRLAVGPFELPDTPGTRNPVEAIKSEDLTDLVEPPKLVPPAAIARRIFPVLDLSEEQATDLGHGKRITVDTDDAPLVAAIAPSGVLVGLVSVQRGATRVVTNFPTTATDQKRP